MCLKVFYWTIMMTICCQLSICEWVDPMDMNKEKSDQWIDPLDMSPSDDYAKYIQNPSSLLHSLKTKNKNSDGIACLQETEIYFKRAINMILHSVQEDKTKLDEFTGHLYFQISIDDYEYLKSFADGINNDNDLSKIDSILERIVSKPTNQKIQEFLETWFHQILRVILTRKGIIFTASILYCYVLFKLIKENFKISYIIKLTLLHMLIIDFLFVWIRLSQKISIEIMAKKIKYEDMPIACNPQTMSYSEYTMYLFSTTDTCQEYHEINMLDTFWAVSPGDVLAEMITRIQVPIKAIGSGFTSVCLGIINGLPWPINLLAFIPVLILFCLFCVLIISLIMGRHIYINMLHLISFSSTTPPPPPVQQIENSRKYVQDIPVHHIEERNESELQFRQQNATTVRETRSMNFEPISKKRSLSAVAENRCTNCESLVRERSVSPVQENRAINFESAVQQRNNGTTLIERSPTNSGHFENNLELSETCFDNKKECFEKQMDTKEGFRDHEENMNSTETSPENIKVQFEKRRYTKENLGGGDCL